MRRNLSSVLLALEARNKDRELKNGQINGEKLKVLILENIALIM